MKILETLQEKIEHLQISLSDDENRKKVLIIAFGILLFLVVILILILCLSPKKDETKLPEDEYEITEYFYSPSSPEITDDYMYSRVPQQKWSEEEANEHITLPTEKMLDELKTANDKLIKDILEASP